MIASASNLYYVLECISKSMFPKYKINNLQ